MNHLISKIKSFFPRKSLIFAIAGAVGGLVGEIVCEISLINEQESFWFIAFNIGLWSSLLSGFISTFLIVAQNYHLKRPLIEWKRYGQTIVIGLCGGFLGGFVAQVMYSIHWFFLGGITFISIIGLIKNSGRKFSEIQTYSLALIALFYCYFFLRGSAWGLMGATIGFAIAYIIPNLKKQAGLLGGLLGGLVGGLFFIGVATIFDDLFGRIIGAASIGFFIGLMIAIIENHFREAWVEVFWSASESAKIGLGSQPLTIGSSPESTIYIPANLGLGDKIGSIIFENRKIFYEEAKTNKRVDFKNGSQITIGKIRILVHEQK